MAVAIQLAHQAMEQNEVPVGAIIVGKGKVLGRGWNRPISLNDPTAHAEILAIRDAAKVVGNYRLPGTTLYTTLEPCPMCAGAIIHARVSRVVFAARDPKNGAAGSVFELLPSDKFFGGKTTCEGGLAAEISSNLLQAFFAEKRKKNM